MSRSIHDWLAHARAAEDAAEIARCLDAAEARAGSFYEWRAILAGTAAIDTVPLERLARVADRTLGVAKIDHEVWGFRDVAEVRSKKLHDEVGARAALEAGVQCFLQPLADEIGRAHELLHGEERFAHGYEWVLLGQGFVATLNDRDGLRRCLEAGLAAARAQEDADDLLSVAIEHATKIDRAVGVALVLEAEALAEKNESARPWSIANAWRALGDPAAAERVLDRALAKSTTTDEAAHVARTWASHDDPDRARIALARAGELAKTVADWLAIGEVAYDGRLGENAIRDAVARAAALELDDDERTRVATAYKVWLDDAASAERVGPRGLAPEALHPPSRALEGWDGSASALFDWLRAHLSPASLEAIVMADYGMDADKHRAALVDICETGLVPKTLQWEPHEVLALTRWSEGEATDHHARALSCVLLCLAPSGIEELVTDGILLADSCLALGAEPTALAERFFAWRAGVNPYGSEEEGDDPEAFVALALLYLVGAAAKSDDPRLDALAQRLVETPNDALGRLAETIAGSMRPHLWNELVERILAPLVGTHAHALHLVDVMTRTPKPGDRAS